MNKTTTSDSIQDTCSQNSTKVQTSLMRKRESMKDSIFTCFYCYYMLISLDTSIKIVLNRNHRQGSKPDEYTRNFNCLSIHSGNNTLFEDGCHYKIIQDCLRKMNTIECDKTGFPIVDTEITTKYYSVMSWRIQHHILIQRINTLLRNYDMQIKYYSRQCKPLSISKILLDSFVDIDSNGNYSELEKPVTSKIFEDTEENNKYNELCEILNRIFFYFLDNRCGKTKQLIITDEIQTKMKREEDCIVLTRNQFLDIVKRVRYNNEEINIIVDSFSKTEVDVNEENKKRERNKMLRNSFHIYLNEISEQSKQFQQSDPNQNLVPYIQLDPSTLFPTQILWFEQQSPNQ